MDTELKPKISVVTVCRNCVSDIRATIESVLSQDYPELEYLIIDGASTDGTSDIIKEYATRISRIICEPDKGVYYAMNKGIRIASGSWINFMNAGDTFVNDSVISEMFSNVLVSSKVIYGNTLFIHKDGSITHHNTANLKILKKTLKSFQPYSHQSAFFNIECKEDCIFDTSYRICSDYNTSITYFKKYGIAAYQYVPMDVVYYRAFGGISDNIYLMENEMNKIRICRNFGIFQVLKSVVRSFLK